MHSMTVSTQSLGLREDEGGLVSKARQEHGVKPPKMGKNDSLRQSENPACSVLPAWISAILQNTQYLCLHHVKVFVMETSHCDTTLRVDCLNQLC